MAYTKTVWETGDVITAAKLNNAEDGIEAANEIKGILCLEMTKEDSTATLSEKAGDIIAAAAAGPVYLPDGDPDIDGSAYYYMLESVVYDDRSPGYHFIFGDYDFLAATVTDYPVASL